MDKIHLEQITEEIFLSLQKMKATKEEMRQIGYRLNWKIKKLFNQNPKKARQAKENKPKKK